MKTHLLGRLPFLRWAIVLLLGLASAAYAAVPPMEVTVFDPSGRIAFKGPVNASSTFTTRDLQPGKYVVQFNAKSAAVKASQYLLVVSAGKKKVIAPAVPGEQFIGGGVAMKVDVGPGLRITGQIANDQTTADQGSSKYRVIDGRRYVWVTTELGSNLGGHWQEEGLPRTAGNVTVWSADELRKRLDRAGEGSMLLYHHRFPGGY